MGIFQRGASFLATFQKKLNFLRQLRGVFNKMLKISVLIFSGN